MLPSYGPTSLTYPSSYYYSPYSLSSRMSSALYSVPGGLYSSSSRPNYYYGSSRPIFVDMANIDVTSSQLPRRNPNSLAPAMYGKIHRGRTVIRLKTGPHNIDYRPPMSPGYKLVEKFTIPDRVKPSMDTAKVRTAHAGAIRRHLSGKRRPSLVTEEGIPVPAASRKCSISEEMLKEEEAIFDSLIMEEIARTNGVPDRRNSFDCSPISPSQVTKLKRYSLDFNAGGGLKTTESLSDFIQKFHADIASGSSGAPSPTESTPEADADVINKKSGPAEPKTKQPIASQSETDASFVLKKPVGVKNTTLADQNVKLKTQVCQLISKQLELDKGLNDTQVCVQMKLEPKVSTCSNKKVSADKTIHVKKVKPVPISVAPKTDPIPEKILLDEVKLIKPKPKPVLKSVEVKQIAPLPEPTTKPVIKVLPKPIPKMAALGKIPVAQNSKVEPVRLPLVLKSNPIQDQIKKLKTKEIPKSIPKMAELKKIPSPDILKPVGKVGNALPKLAKKITPDSASTKKSQVLLNGNLQVAKFKVSGKGEVERSEKNKLKNAVENDTKSKTSTGKKKVRSAKKSTPLESNKVTKMNGVINGIAINGDNNESEKKVPKVPRPIDWKMVDVGRSDFADEITEMNGLTPEEESESENEYTSSDDEDSDESSSSDNSMIPDKIPYSCRHKITHSHKGRIVVPASTIPRYKKYTVHDFNFIKVLGKGSFGKVLLAGLKGTEYYYAVKCLKKDVVLEDDDVECTLIERKVLTLSTKHPYLCHLFCTFQTLSHLFFVMEYLNGGDLMFHIQQSGRFDEGRARFYAAEIVSGLRFLHRKGIVYRDLKLDNILLDCHGHVRIADFGMCKLQIYLDKTVDTFCGTPDYMAPEIIKGLKYNQCVDWWSFGILLYEMLVGKSPFSGCDEDQLFWSICNEQPLYPKYLSVVAKALLVSLLKKEAIERLGSSGCNSGDDVMTHDFFRGLDWSRLERREIEPPYKPRVFHPLDTHYFDQTFTKEKPRLSPIEASVLASMDQSQFLGFSYTNPNATDS